MSTEPAASAGPAAMDLDTEPAAATVTDGIFVTLRDKAIRDPFDGATRVVTVRVSAMA